MPLEYALQHRGKNPDLGPWKVASAIQAVLKDTLGVDVLPKQRCVRIGRAPFVFNVMVMGETGLGKTTFMNTLFNTDLTEKIVPKYPQKTTQVTVNPAQFELKEDNVTLHLSVIDTPGFGDQLNREKNLQPILDYIDTQYENYLNEENKKTFRQAIPDTRVHAVLYFISPGYGLRHLDIVALKELSEKVNIIPVIAKADTMLAEERQKVKDKVLNQIKKNDIKLYSIDHCDEDDLREDLRQHVPFAVMGSQSLVDNGTEKVRGRKYRWGIVEVDNPEHNDFIHLQQMLMNTCLQDLIETTHYKHYALYRANEMRKNGRPPSVLQCDEGYDGKSVPPTEDTSGDEFTRKEEEMRQKFVQMVREKESSLRDKEEQLHQKSKQLMAEIEAERRQLEAEEREIDNLLAQREQMSKKPSVGKSK